MNDVYDVLVILLVKNAKPRWEQVLPFNEPPDPRAGHAFIDDEELLAWSSESDEDEPEDEFDAEEDELEAAAFEDLRAEDEDWEIAERGMSHSSSM